MSITSDRVVATLAHLHRYADSHPNPADEPRIPPLTIAISRQAGSRGGAIGRAVGDELGWPVYDNELLARIAEERGLHSKLLEHLDERHVSWLEEMMDCFSTSKQTTETAYLRSLLELLASLSKVGHCVIIGRGGCQILPPTSTLRVRIVAPYEDRLNEVQKRMSVSKAEAKKWVDQTDKSRVQFVKQCFNREPDDPTTFDLVINSSRFSTEECVRMITQTAKAVEARLVAAGKK